ncbi:MAG: 50S ribosomal protein L5 [Candidatus Bathyarchaeota archaeon]
MTVSENQGHSKNPMTKAKIAKVVINMSVGKSGEPLEKASSILEQLTAQKPCRRKAKQTIKDWGIRKGEPIACMVTLRKQKAFNFLKGAFVAVGNKIPITSFDDHGNFAFGIKEHIELPDTKYDPELGIVGMNVTVALDKPGYRIKERKRARSKVGKKHLVTPEEAFQLLDELFGVKIEKKEDEE